MKNIVNAIYHVQEFLNAQTSVQINAISVSVNHFMENVRRNVIDPNSVVIFAKIYAAKIVHHAWKTVIFIAITLNALKSVANGNALLTR